MKKCKEMTTSKLTYSLSFDAGSCKSDDQTEARGVKLLHAFTKTFQFQLTFLLYIINVMHATSTTAFAQLLPRTLLKCRHSCNISDDK